MTNDCGRHQVSPQKRVVVGCGVDGETRCAHYHSASDVIAVKFACCDEYYPCFQCHDQCVDHEAERWPRERFDEPAVLCGVCGTELSVTVYLNCDHECPTCEATFNPGCRNHLDRYFAVDSAD